MTSLQFRSGFNGDTTCISSIRIQLTGSLDRSYIDAIKVYYEAQGGNLTFDRGGGDDVDAIDPSVPRPVTFDSGSTKDISINKSIAQFSRPPGGDSFLYIAFDFASNADRAADVGCEIAQVTYGDPPGGTGGTGSPAGITPHGIKQNVDDYEVSLTATGTVPAEAEQGDLRVGTLKLEFTASDPTATANMDSIKLHMIGTGSDGDVATGGVILYDDAGTASGVFDGGDQEVAGSAGTISGGYVTLNPTTNLTVNSSGVIYFVAMNIAADAGVGNTVGLEVENPSTDIVFIDVEADQYIQKGYIASSISIPTSGHTVIIKERITADMTPPTISYKNPDSSEDDIPIDTNVIAVFSETMDPSTISSATFNLKDEANRPVTGSVTYAGSKATFNPSENFAYSTTYTATLTTGITDLAGNPLTSDYAWSFTTTSYVNEPVAYNNRILPGSDKPVQVHVPEPEDGPDSRITVQIFTIKGQRIATLVDNRPYSQIVDSLPLLWYGKNGRQQKLGPGLYFIQIRTKSYKKVLKVLIVR